MLQRVGGYLETLPPDVRIPEESHVLQARGYVVIKDVFDAGRVADLAAELNQLYTSLPADDRTNGKRPADEDNDFRYECYNRSPLAQRTIAEPRLLEVLAPLLGDDCHIIANTCWRNPPRASNTHGGGFWHIDAGPHVPRPAGVPWPQDIPYPIFAVGAHIYLQDCPIECGPTGAIPYSHTSGQRPPADRVRDANLSWNGNGVEPLLADAGDVTMFVSDVWHRRLPARANDAGRFFLQAHYGRRDVAQRVRTTAQVNHVSEAARQRIASDRERRLLGLHSPFFYDG